MKYKTDKNKVNMKLYLFFFTFSLVHYTAAAASHGII